MNEYTAYRTTTAKISDKIFPQGQCSAFEFAPTEPSGKDWEFVGCCANEKFIFWTWKKKLQTEECPW